MKTFDIGHGTPLANPFTSMGKEMPAFQKVDSHEQAMTMYEEYLRRMLEKAYVPMVEAMETLAEAYIEDGKIGFTYNQSEEGHGEVILKIIQEVLA